MSRHRLHAMFTRCEEVARNTIRTVNAAYEVGDAAIARRF